MKATFTVIMMSTAKENLKKTLDPDSEAFFNEFRRLLAPTVLSANLVMRMLGNEARPPKVYETFRKLLMDQKRQAEHIFKKLDLNGDGHISRQEFVEGCIIWDTSRHRQSVNCYSLPWIKMAMVL